MKTESSVTFSDRIRICVDDNIRFSGLILSIWNSIHWEDLSRLLPNSSASQNLHRPPRDACTCQRRRHRHDEPRRHVRAGLQPAERVIPADTSSFRRHLPPQRGRHRDARGGNDAGPHARTARCPRRDPHPLHPPLEDRLRACRS
jgi:hypothetical protein